MTIPVVNEIFHTMCSVRVRVISNTYSLRQKWKANRYSNSTISFKSSRFQIPNGERWHDNTSSKRNISYTICSVRLQQMLIPNTYCLQQKWKANKYSPFPQFLLNHLGFKYVGCERTWWMLFQKRVVRAEFDI